MLASFGGDEEKEGRCEWLDIRGWAKLEPLLPPAEGGQLAHMVLMSCCNRVRCANWYGRIDRDDAAKDRCRGPKLCAGRHRSSASTDSSRKYARGTDAFERAICLWEEYSFLKNKKKPAEPVAACNSGSCQNIEISGVR